MMIKYLEKKLYEQTKAESIKFSARKMAQKYKRLYSAKTSA